MGKVLRDSNLAVGSTYCFMVRNYGSLRGLLIGKRNDSLIVDTEIGIVDIIPKGSIYFYYKDGNNDKEVLC